MTNKKHATCTKRGKTHVSQATIRFGLVPDWLKKEHVCSDWLQQVARGFCRMLNAVDQLKTGW